MHVTVNSDGKMLIKHEKIFFDLLWNVNEKWEHISLDQSILL